MEIGRILHYFERPQWVESPHKKVKGDIHGYYNGMSPLPNPLIDVGVDYGNGSSKLRFLFDTGADRSLIRFKDAEKILLAREKPIKTSMLYDFAGNGFDAYEFKADLTFSTDKNELVRFNTQSIYVPSPNVEFGFSLLGMDIIRYFHGEIVIGETLKLKPQKSAPFTLYNRKT